MSAAPRILDPQPANVQAAARFRDHQKTWRSRAQRYYPRHADIEPFAPAVLAPMFDRGVKIVGPAREYAYRVEAAAQTVRLNADTWHWYCLDGTADGRGLYELWAWRWELDVPSAATELWVALNVKKERTA